MCIRDSGGLDGLLYITDISWGRISHPTEVLKLDQKINVVAVSYTHLRAHETVLDLVCRLLIEKKHTHTQHTQLSWSKHNITLHVCHRHKRNTRAKQARIPTR